MKNFYRHLVELFFAHAMMRLINKRTKSHAQSRSKCVLTSQLLLHHTYIIYLMMMLYEEFLPRRLIMHFLVKVGVV